MASGPIPPHRLTEYRKKGYTLVRRMFDSREIDVLRRSAKQDKAFDDHSFGRDDGRGKIVRLSLRNHPGDTIYGMFARCESIVNSPERILDGEVRHYQFGCDLAFHLRFNDRECGEQGPKRRNLPLS
jgi:ectoine hydroxylase